MGTDSILEVALGLLPAGSPVLMGLVLVFFGARTKNKLMLVVGSVAGGLGIAMLVIAALRYLVRAA